MAAVAEYQTLGVLKKEVLLVYSSTDREVQEDSVILVTIFMVHKNFVGMKGQGACTKQKAQGNGLTAYSRVKKPFPHTITFMPSQDSTPMNQSSLI